MELNLRDKVAMITGAGSGIGRELTKKLHALGARVIAISQTSAKLDSLNNELGGKITTVCVDLGNWKETETKLKELCQKVDFLVNNAGFSISRNIDQISEEEFIKTTNINLAAPMNLIKMVAPGMKERKFGSIVNVSSVAGIAALEKHFIYGATKAALDMVTKIASKELGPFNVRVNSVNPTVVMTDMSVDYWNEPSRKQKMLALIPMNRFVDVREVVEPIIFLLSSMSSMINGIMLPVDGGFVAN